MKTAIIIPARYASTRFPGKPLVKIAGKTMLERVVGLAQKAAADDFAIHVIVATDDKRIADHAKDIGAACVMTPESCPTGTDRVAQAVQKLDFVPDFVLNLQGDAPMTPPAYLRALIDSFTAAPCDLVTPVVRLSWDKLDALRTNKKTTPFSGTTAVFNETTGDAYWFSKNILPAIRQEDKLRTESPLSPIWRHIGIYGYARPMLEKFSSLPEGQFEEMEGLEQLRLIENGFKIRCVPVATDERLSLSGIDSPEDITHAEALITQFGEM